MSTVSSKPSDSFSELCVQQEEHWEQRKTVRLFSVPVPSSIIVSGSYEELLQEKALFSSGRAPAALGRAEGQQGRGEPGWGARCTRTGDGRGEVRRVIIYTARLSPKMLISSGCGLPAGCTRNVRSSDPRAWQCPEQRCGAARDSAAPGALLTIREGNTDGASSARERLCTQWDPKATRAMSAGPEERYRPGKRYREPVLSSSARKR